MGLIVRKKHGGSFLERLSGMREASPAGLVKPYPYGLQEPLLMLRPGVPYTIRR